jgi:lambda repressor-like predicted transcriptional regulator
LFTPEVVSAITRLHVEGKSKEEISRQTGIKKNTLAKALS